MRTAILTALALLASCAQEGAADFRYDAPPAEHDSSGAPQRWRPDVGETPDVLPLAAQEAGYDVELDAGHDLLPQVGPEAGLEAARIDGLLVADADGSPPLPATCAALQARINSVSSPCGGYWPGTLYPCMKSCQDDKTGAYIGPADQLWACNTWTDETHENAGHIVCVGGGSVGCNTYCPRQ